MAEPAPTRRSRRISPTPLRASAELAEAARADAQRRTADAVAVAVIATVAAVDAEQGPSPVVEQAAPVLTRRSRRDARLAAEPVSAAEPFELVEPPVDTVASDPLAATDPVVDEDTADLDAFDLAARLFAFTGENSVVGDRATPTASESPIPSFPTADAVVRGRRPGLSFRRVAATSFSIGVMGVVGLLTVGLTTPAEAVAAAGGSLQAMSVRAPVATDVQDSASEEIQAYVAPAGTQNADVTRAESYSTETMAELAQASGISNVSNFFVNDPTADIQWPFAVGVPISYGFGVRSGRMHEGVDFTPGEGSPIQAIADGTVRVATGSGGAFGTHVIIDHEIDGQLISSHYAHMISGSLQVTPGERVTVGTVLGRTGNTGRSFGAHTHFEMLVNGTTPIDPLPWLREHAGG